jgi:hypothetical protein
MFSSLAYAKYQPAPGWAAAALDALQTHMRCGGGGGGDSAGSVAGSIGAGSSGAGSSSVAGEGSIAGGGGGGGRGVRSGGYGLRELASIGESLETLHLQPGEGWSSDYAGAAEAAIRDWQTQAQRKQQQRQQEDEGAGASGRERAEAEPHVSPPPLSPHQCVDLVAGVAYVMRPWLGRRSGSTQQAQVQAQQQGQQQGQQQQQVQQVQQQQQAQHQVQQQQQADDADAGEDDYGDDAWLDEAAEFEEGEVEEALLQVGRPLRPHQCKHILSKDHS